MTIQILLTMGLLSCALYVLLQAKVSAHLNNVIYAATLVGSYFVWFPEQSTRIAQLLGVGRGADLILYLWVVISIVIAFNLHLKLAIEARRTTLLARHMALLDAWDAEALPERTRTDE